MKESPGPGRVVTVLRKYDPDEWGGTETHVVEIARRLGREGWENRVLAPAGPRTPETALPSSVPLERYRAYCPFVGDPAKRRALVANGGNIVSIDLALRLAADRSFDLAHVHTGGRIAGAVRAAARWNKRPFVMSCHGPLLAGGAFQEREIARRASGTIDLGKPVGWLLGARRILEDAARVIVFSDEEHTALASRIGRRAVRMDHGVDVGRIEGGCALRARAKYPMLGARPFALVLGRLSTQKNQVLAVEAFAVAAPRDWDLVLAGAETDPGYRVAIERAAREAGVEGRVHLLGNVDGRSEVPDLLAAASLLLAPSQHEAFGLVVLEAWAAGCPTLFVARHGLADLGRALGVRAATVADLELTSWTRALGELCRAPAAREAIANAGLDLVRARYTWEKATSALARLYVEVVEECSSMGRTRPASQGVAGS